MEKKIVQQREYTKVFQVLDSREWQRENETYARMREVWEEVGQKLYVPPAPLHVDIEVTNDCNLKCFMCERKFMKRPVGYMSLPLFHRIVDECALHHIQSIKLNLWGESVLHPHLSEMIAYAKAKGIANTQFNTNASLLSEDKSREIVEAGLDRITLSVDSLSKGAYEDIRMGSKIDHVIKNIENLLVVRRELGRTKPFVTAQIIRMKKNEEGVALFAERFKDKVDYVSVTNVGAACGDQGILKYSLLDYDQTRKFPCMEIWRRLSISWGGDVTVCCQDYDFKLRIGNLLEKGLVSLWWSNELQNLRERHRLGDFKDLLCETCTANCEMTEKKAGEREEEGWSQDHAERMET